MAEQPRIISAADAAAEAIAHAQKIGREVYADGGDVVLNVGYEYRVALDRCNTAPRLLGWILHLADKDWMTNDHLAAFILLVGEKNQIEIDYKI